MILFFTSVFCYDIWFYLFHILLHKPFLYEYHKEHHAQLVPTLKDAYVGHSLEMFGQGLGMFIPFFFSIPTSQEFILILAFLNLRGMMRHDERFVFLIGNHHLLHHKYPNKNFGEYWIDSLCGTRYPHQEEYQRGWIYI